MIFVNRMFPLSSLSSFPSTPISALALQTNYVQGGQNNSTGGKRILKAGEGWGVEPPRKIRD
jgi:hypothetical protein